jgi:hypothetical protein
MATAALGFAPHSGWAVAIGVCAAGRRPRIVLRDRIPMTASGDLRAKHPYHAVEGMDLAEAAERLAADAASAETMAYEAVRRLAARLADEGHRVAGAGILDSVGRKGVPLASILASHALVHAAEGDHFRSALDGAATRCGLPVVRVPARELDSRAARADGRPIAALRALLDTVGRPMGPPWGADQKAAALLGWLVLATAAREDQA